jgi:phosphatidylglycerol:prolipoprotein diacylglycerol transferase
MVSIGIIFALYLAGKKCEEFGVKRISIFSKQIRTSFFKITDLISLFPPLAQSVGRIRCFLNGDSYGTVTSISWGVKFPGLSGRRHLTQIYESLLALFLFILLYLLYHKKLFKIERNLTISYLIGYSLIASLSLAYYKNVYEKSS